MRFTAATVIPALLAPLLLTVLRPQLAAVHEHLHLCSLYDRYGVGVNDFQALKQRLDEQLLLTHPDKALHNASAKANAKANAKGTVWDLAADRRRAKGLETVACRVALPEWVLTLDLWAVAIAFAFTSAGLRSAFNRFPSLTTAARDPSGAVTATASDGADSADPSAPRTRQPVTGRVSGAANGSRRIALTALVVACSAALATVPAVDAAAAAAAEVNSSLMTEIAVSNREYVDTSVNRLPPCAEGPCAFAVCECTDVGWFSDDYYVFYTEQSDASERNAVSRTVSYRVRLPPGALKPLTQSTLGLTLANVLIDGQIDLFDVVNVLSAHKLKAHVDNALEAQKLLQIAAISWDSSR